MIATLVARSPLHRQQLAFGALLVGLQADKVSARVLEVTYQDPTKVLNIVRTYGGRVVSTVSHKKHGEF